MCTEVRSKAHSSLSLSHSLTYVPPADVLKRQDAGVMTVLVDGVPLGQLQEFEKAVSGFRV